jgi:hypothetical protein
MSEPTPSDGFRCKYDLDLIKPKFLKEYNFVLKIPLPDLKKFFSESKLYGKLTNSIAKYHPQFFENQYKSIKLPDITYYYKVHRQSAGKTPTQ